MGALATRERPTLRAFLWLGRACPVEFGLGFVAQEFLRQELREEHTHFTRHLCLALQLSGVAFALALALALALPLPLPLPLQRYRETLYNTPMV